MKRLPSMMTLAASAALTFLSTSGAVEAAAATGCEGGGFRVVTGNHVINADGKYLIPVASMTEPFRIRVIGKYVEFDIVPASFEIENWLFTGAPNPLDITGGQRTVIWERKTPNHRGLILSGRAEVERKEDSIVIKRSGNGLDMKIQAKDCAQGGIFQMEPERDDARPTRVTHVLAQGLFYFDNPRFRAREGDVVPYKDTTVTVSTRINIANNVSAKLVARDSAQVANRVPEPNCLNIFLKRDGVTKETVLHCGRVSRWDIASGGRMGFVTGQDATEVAPPATDCIQDCQAQNQVRGRAVNLGFPFPVPASSRLKPAFP